MSGYCCIEFRKIKSAGQLSAAYAHNFREIEVANADINKRNLNKEIIDLNGYNYIEYFNNYMKDLASYGCQTSVRKNAVLAYELVLTFSREERERIDIDEWETENIKWLEEHFNSRGIQKPDGTIVPSKNIASVIRHDDEAGNIHLHAIIIPVDERGKLNSRGYMQGKREFYDMHDSYAKAMKKFDLKRGEYYSTAIHKNIKEFYTSINKIEETKLPEPMPEETLEQYRERANQIFKEAQHHWFNKNLKLERERDNAKTFNIQKEMEYKEKKKALHLEKRKLADLLDIDETDPEFEERIRELRHDIKKLKLFEDALTEYPDKEKVCEVKTAYEEMLLWSKENEKKKKKNVGHGSVDHSDIGEDIERGEKNT